MSILTAAEVDAAAEDAASPEDHALASAFRARAQADDLDDPWAFLAAVFDIHLRHSNPDEPFGPMFVSDGRRSMIPADLTDGQVAILQQLMGGVVTPGLRCRIGDLLWVARRDGRAGRQAVPAYIQTGIMLESPETWPPSLECYERAVRLARSFGRNGPLLREALQHIADRVVHYNGNDPSFFTSRALSLLDEFRFGDPAALSVFALAGAKRRDLADDAYSARPYWDIAARLLTRASMAAEAEQARIGSAETWVKEAEQKEAAGNYGAAQSHLDSAIQAYRLISSCKHLLPQLHRRLDAAGAEALKQMRQISSDTIDIGPMARAAQASLKDLPMAEAIYALACVAPSMDPQRLRAQAEDLAQRAPLTSMMSSVMYDRAGRVVHKTPGLYTDDPDEREQALEAQVSRHADMHRHLIVSAQIGPALLALLSEHNVDEADLTGLLEGSVLIPPPRMGLFVMGLVAGFRRDMATAMHLLIPQLEHALRTLLRNEGIITASIDQDGIQSDWPLGRLLSTSVVGPILPDTLAFELRSLLIFKGSSNLRNRLCHGLLDPEEFGTGNVIYLWWLLLKVSLHGTPGFQAWIDERARSQGRDERDQDPQAVHS